MIICHKGVNIGQLHVSKSQLSKDQGNPGQTQVCMCIEVEGDGGGIQN